MPVIIYLIILLKEKYILISKSLKVVKLICPKTTWCKYMLFTDNVMRNDWYHKHSKKLSRKYSELLYVWHRLIWVRFNTVFCTIILRKGQNQKKLNLKNWPFFIYKFIWAIWYQVTNAAKILGLTLIELIELIKNIFFWLISIWQQDYLGSLILELSHRIFNTPIFSWFLD